MADWYFPHNDEGDIKGLNETGAAIFRGTPLKSLAREICQNSLDAARGETVRVEFSAFSIPTSKLPGAAVLKDTFERCADFWSNDKQTKNFFTNAFDKISAERINMLRISDFNTCGLTGSKEEAYSNWIGLTKSSGVSMKEVGSSGSFGIGKFAPFACSDFSTVFYSTYDEEDIKASQGVSRIATFCRKDGRKTQGYGYYGNGKSTPMYAVMDLEKIFTRHADEYGTDIYIAAYRYAEDDWGDSIVISILDSFLGAIWNSKLEVKVGDIEVSRAVLPELIDAYREGLTGYARQYYTVLVSPNTKWFDNDFMKMGSIRLGLLIEKDMHRKVAMIRRGMKILDRDRISGYIPFAGVMFLEGKKLNDALKKMENIEHTDWQPARTQTPVLSTQIVKSLNDFIKDCLEKLISEGSKDEMDAVGVGTYIPDMPESDKDNAIEEAVTNKIDSIEKTVVKKSNLAGQNDKELEDMNDENGDYTEGNSEEGWLHEGNNKKNPEPKPPMPVDSDNTGRYKVPLTKEIEPEKIIFVCIDKVKGKYMLMFVPSADGTDGYLRLDISGESENYQAPLVKAELVTGKKLNVENGRILGLDFQKNVPIKLNFQLDYSDYCSLEVRAYAH